ncbi:immunity 53 family protein [Paenibacillus sp. Leaf72]|uniref:immunity 53 family protein n=1 Tax=Paenibacillus sp. Leaf72 TaxID=1736234 RepID=UPI0006F7D0D4|nr:immunity 53 family protein [Paenibacillus sp. Leaf72]KQO15414.1 rhodanese-related sulfurtransferase [Paenibacillus sp. Leaf72]
MDILRWLQEWYSSQCDGEWEHESGIRITSIDNPGWHVAINLIGTTLEDKQVDLIQIERTEEDWIYCKIEDGCFSGAGGPGNLEDVLRVFYLWATND